MHYFSVMTDYLQKKVREQPTIDNLKSLSAALMEIQQYRDSHNILERILQLYPSDIDKDKLKINMEFCKNPVPGINTLKNLNHSWLHNFVLVRLGKRRYNFLREDDYLTTNSIIRQSK